MDTETDTYVLRERNRKGLYPLRKGKNQTRIEKGLSLRPFNGPGSTHVRSGRHRHL
nr:hypothetical protein Iba_chr06aCG16860 [Ipomoea batatas]GMD06367.1 hypothetical protein Iba_chr06bCG15360 [Ipomoea batatas]